VSPPSPTQAATAAKEARRLGPVAADALRTDKATASRYARNTEALSGPLGNNPYFRVPQTPRAPQPAPVGNPMFPNGNPMGAMSQYLMDPRGAPGSPAESPVATPGINPSPQAPQAPQAPQQPQQPKSAPTSFMADMYQRASTVYNDPEEALVAAAQAALETGHGRSVPGGNYFGIKSTTGEGNTTDTWEVIDGQRVRTKATWEEHGSPEQSLAARERFLKENPRYAKAGYFDAQTAEEKAEALARAGYATDPAYANKLKSMIAQLRQGNDAGTYTTGDPDGTSSGPVDTRVASTGGAAGPAIDPNTLPDRSPQGTKNPPAWLPEGYGSVQEWVTEPLSQERGVQVGPFRLYPKEMLGRATPPEEAMRRRAMIAQAMSQPGMTPYQEAQIRLKRDRLNQDILESEYDRVSGRAGGTVTEPAAPPSVPGSDIVLQGSPELYQQKYGDSGTTGVRDYTKAVESVETTLAGVAEAMDVMERGFDENALGPRWDQASVTGQAADAVGSFLGSAEADKDKAIRGQVDQLKFKLIQPFLDSMKGALSDKDMKLLLDAAPGVTSTQEEWQRFRDRAVRTAAKGIAHLNPQISEEQAFKMALQKFQQYRSRTDPSRRLPKDAQQFYDTPQGAQELDQFYD